MKTFLLAALALAALVSAAAMFAKQRQAVVVEPDAATACRKLLALEAQVPAAARPSGCSAVGETFAAVNLSDGQSVRAVVSNVLTPAAGTPSAVCPVAVQFFSADGTVIGSAETVDLNPGESASVAAGSKSGMLRANFAVLADPSDPTKPGDPNGICAIRSTQEVFQVSTGKTVSINPSPNCVGNGVSAGFTRPCA